jgi:hypothetical protein
MSTSPTRRAERGPPPLAEQFAQQLAELRQLVTRQQAESEAQRAEWVILRAQLEERLAAQDEEIARLQVETHVPCTTATFRSRETPTRFTPVAKRRSRATHRSVTAHRISRAQHTHPARRHMTWPATARRAA